MIKPPLTALTLCSLTWGVALSASTGAGASAAPTTAAALPLSGSHLAEPYLAAEDPYLQGLLRQTLALAPRLQAAQARYEALKHQAGAAQALPDPQLSGSVRNVGLGRISLGDEAMSGNGVMVQQNYPHPKKLALRQRQADTEHLQQRARLQQLTLELRREVQSHYVQALAAQQKQRVYQAMDAWYALLQQVVQTRYQVAKVPLQDIWQVKLRRSELQAQQLKLAEEETLHWTALQNVMGRPARFERRVLQAQPQLPGQTDVEVLSLNQVFPWASAVKSSGFFEPPAFTEHPALQTAQWQQELAQVAIQSAEAERQSDYFVAGGLTYRGMLEPIWEVKGGMTLPVYGDTKIEPRVAAARSQLTVAEAAYADALQRLQGQWQNEVERWQYSQRQHQLYRQQILPEAKTSVNAALAAYRGGQQEVAQVIESITRWLNYQQQVIGLEAQMYLALNTLEYLRGEQDGF